MMPFFMEYRIIKASSAASWSFSDFSEPPSSPVYLHLSKDRLRKAVSKALETAALWSSSIKSAFL